MNIFKDGNIPEMSSIPVHPIPKTGCFLLLSLSRHRSVHQDPRIQKWSAPRFFHGMTTDEMDSSKDIHTIMRLFSSIYREANNETHSNCSR